MKNKIVFITPAISGGGAEKNMVNTINSIDLKEFDITLIICGGDLKYLDLLPKYIEIKYLNRKTVSKSYFQIFKILIKEKPKIVFTSFGHLSLPVTFIQKIFFQKYINITRVPSLPSNKLGKSIKSKLLYFPIVLAYRNSDLVIAQTSQMKNEIEVLWKVPFSKIFHIPNIINANQIKELASHEHKFFDDTCFNVIAMGALYSVKGFDLLIQAISLIKITLPNVRLYILGKESIEKGYKYKLEQLIKSLDLEKHVFLIGFKSNPYPYLKNADLFVLSSRKEGFPNVVLEALTLGIPVVATDCVDFENIINDGENGYIVPKNNVQALAEGIIKGKNLNKMFFKQENFNFNEWFNEILLK